MSPIDLVLARLPRARKSGPDRWRDACPVCGERNRSTLSVGVTDAGAVLVRCFKSGCDVTAICAALGLDVADLFSDRKSSARPIRRRRLLTSDQALDLVHFEMSLVALVASDIGRGLPISAPDRARVLTAAGRIAYLRNEVQA